MLFMVIAGIVVSAYGVEADTLKPDTADVIVQQISGDSVPMTNFLPELGGFTFSFVRLLRGLLGMFVLIFIAWIFSTNRRAISWKMVGTGLLIQLILAVGILYVPFIQFFFEVIGKVFIKILAFRSLGTHPLL